MDSRMSYKYVWSHDNMPITVLREQHDGGLGCEYAPHTTLPHVKLLPPPKSMLGPGSIIVQRRDYFYGISIMAGERPSNVVALEKQAIYNDIDKVRITGSAKRFDKVLGITSDVKYKKWSITFNKGTKKLYFIYHKRVKNAKNKYITVRCFKSFGINPSIVFSMSLKPKPIIFKHFVDIIEQEVLKAVPGAVTQFVNTQKELPKPRKHKIITPEPTTTTERLYILMAQLKAGVPIHFIDEIYIDNITRLFSPSSINNMVSPLNSFYFKQGKCSPPKKEVIKFHKKYLYKLFPALAKKPSPKTVYKHILGPYYSKLIGKLLLAGKLTESVTTLAIPIAKGLLNKTAIHLINHLMDGKYSCLNEKEKRSLISNIALSQTAVLSPAADTREIKVANDYLRLLKILLDKNSMTPNHNRCHPPLDLFSVTNAILNYHTFSDLCEMAHTFGIRLRLSKFNTLAEVITVHNTLTAYQNRDNINLKEYGHIKFLPLNLPKGVYSGYNMVQLLSGEDLVNEGKYMDHCVGGHSYIKKCMKGVSLIFSLRASSESKVTIELDGTSNTLNIRQMHMMHDHRVTDDLHAIIEKWHSDLVRIHKRDNSTYKVRANLFMMINNKVDASDIEVKEFIDNSKLPTIEQIKEQLKTLLSEEGVDTNIVIGDNRTYDNVTTTWLPESTFTCAPSMSI